MKKLITSVLILLASSAQAQSLDIEAYNRLVQKQLQALEDQEAAAYAKQLADAHESLSRAISSSIKYRLCVAEARRAGHKPYACI